jgi:hypothetical protein
MTIQEVVNDPGTLITYILGLSLVFTGLKKSYHFEKYQTLISNEKVNDFTFIRKIIGNKYTSFIWIFPFKIEEYTKNVEAKNQIDKFNKTSVYFRYIWATLIIWSILYILYLNNHQTV